MRALFWCYKGNKMQFIGKILGFFIGYQITHSIFGALFGVFLGHMVDKKRYEQGKVQSSFFGKNISRQSLFMQTTFAVLGHLAKSKGRVTEEDIHLARSLMAKLNLDAKSQQLAQDAFTQGKASSFPLREVIREFRLACGQRTDLLRFFVEVQIQAAVQDGVLDANEKRVLNTIAETMGISQFQFDQMIQMILSAQQFRNFDWSQQRSSHQNGYSNEYRQSSYSNAPSLDDACKVLGVSANDDQKTVKRAYRKLMNEHHPDKLEAKGLPPEMMEMAKEKAQQIQAAYDFICKNKGWK